MKRSRMVSVLVLSRCDKCLNKSKQTWQAYKDVKLIFNRISQYRESFILLFPTNKNACIFISLIALVCNMIRLRYLQEES